MTRFQGLRAARWPLVLGLCGVVSSCIASYQTVPWVDTQRYPGPMEQRANLPPGSQDDYPKGPEVVLVVRHADPVQVRRAGLPQGTPMAFYDKRARVHSGSWVHSGDGGRAEVLWPHGTSVLLIGTNTGIVGSTSRGDPTFVLREMASVRIEPTREERITLLGGAVLVASQGPVMIERMRSDILELRNQSEDDVTVEYRDDTLVIEPGEVVDLALLSSGAAPRPRARSYDRLLGTGYEVQVAGDVSTRIDGAEVEIASDGPTEIQGLGVSVNVGSGERVTINGLGAPLGPLQAVAPPAQPASEDGTPDEDASGDEARTTEPTDQQ